MKKDNKKETAKAVNEGRPGYKHTTLGWIPEEWAYKKLGDLTEKVGSGITPTGGDKVYKKKGRYFLRSQNVGWSELLLDDVAFIDEETHKSFQSTELQFNDVLLNITGASIGRSAIADLRIIGGNVNQHVCIIRTNSKLIPAYLNMFLISSIGQNLINSYQAGGNRQGLNFEQIRSFPIPIPALEEQQKIASIILTWDNAITKTQKLIVQLKQRNKGLMQELLTGKKGWYEKKLSDIFQRVVDKNTIGNTNVITISAQRGFVKQDDFFKKIVASDILDNYFLVKKEDFCYNKSYSNGYDWGAIKRLNDFDLAVVTTLYICFRIKNSTEYSGDYFEYFFDANLLDKGLAKIAHEGGRAHGLLNVTPTDFFSLKILVPSYKDQLEIFNILSTANDELKIAAQILKWLQSQKRGLMQKLLTGEIRTKFL